MKRLMMVIVFSAAMQLVADTETVGEYTWTYRIKGDTAEIYNSYSAAVSPRPTGAMTIPDTLGGKPVTSIGDSAFNWCSGLTSVTIPDSVTSIGYSAFSGCSGLTSVTIPAAVKNIGSEAFAWCSGMRSFEVSPDNECYKSVDGFLLTKDGGELVSVPGGLTSVAIPFGVTDIWDGAAIGCGWLTSITMPESVTRIGEFAFYSCDSLKSVTIPAGVASIGKWAFSSCESLISFEVSPDNESYKSVDGLILSSDGKELVAVPAGRTRVTIPAGVTSIGPAAFGDNYCLWNVTIPDGVTNIGEDAFCGCEMLISVAMPNTVTNIGENAFNGCMSLPSVTIPDGVTSIGDYAFSSCESLPSVTIPDGVTSIGDGAFWRCLSLTHIVIPANVTSIGIEAFYDCQSLTDAFLPVSLDGVIDVSSVFDDYTAIHFYSGSEPAYFTLTLDVNGGTALDEPEVKAYAGASVGVLPVPTRPNYLFLGWFTAADGDDRVTEDAVVDGDMTLYAHWTESPFYAMGGNATWRIDVDGSWRSGAIRHNQLTWAEINVPGPCEVSFMWRTSSERSCDMLLCYLDNVQKLSASGMMEDWQSNTVVVPESGRHTIRFEYTKDGSVSGGQDCGWVKDFTIKVPPSHTITLNANGGMFDGEETFEATVYEGQTLDSILVPSRKGYEFVGWLGANGKRVPNDFVVTEDIALTALWLKASPWRWYRDGYGNAVISGAKNTSVVADGAITIPVALSSLNEDGEEIDVPVVGIDQYAFYGWDFETLVLPNNVTWIDDYAFFNCRTLTNVIFEGGRESVDMRVDWVFENTPWLDAQPFTWVTEDNDGEVCLMGFYGSPVPMESFVIPDEVCRIKRYALPNFGDKVFAEGYRRFIGWYTAAEDGDRVDDDDNVAVVGGTTLYAHWESVTPEWQFDIVNGNAIIRGNSVSLVGDVVIPSSVVAEMEDGEGGVFEVTYPVTGIGTYAFEDYEGITSVVIPSCVTNIQPWAFGWCSSLTNVVFEGGMDGVNVFREFFGTPWVATLPRPENDEYGNASEISGASGSVDGTLYGATIADNDCIWRYGDAERTVWYKWVAPFTGDVKFVAKADNGQDSLLYLVATRGYDEDSGDWNDCGYDHGKSVEFNVKEGETYYVSLATWNYVVSGFVLSWQQVLPPENDDFKDAISISGRYGSVVGTNSGAGIEEDEPLVPFADSTATVWWKWTAPTSGSFMFNTQGSDFDTVLGVYSGSAVNALVRIADNDDKEGNEEDDYTSGVVFDAVAGVTYYIAVGGYESSSGDIILSWSITGVDTVIVTFNANGGNGEMAGMAYICDEEQGIVSNAFTKIGHSFAGWSTEKDGAVVYADGEVIKFGVDDADTTLYAVWSVNSYKVAFDFSGGVDSNGNARVEYELPYGTEIAPYIPEPSRQDYTFLSWTTEVDETVPPHDVEYVADWKRNMWIVSLDPAGGICAVDTLNVPYLGNVGELPVAVRDNHTFAGWRTEDGSEVYAYTVPDGDVTYYAYWTFNGTIDVRTAIAEGDDALGKVTGAKDAVKPGTKLTLKATANKGAAFAGWFTNDVLAAATASYSYVAGGVDDVAFEARFVSQADDELFVEGTNLAFTVKETVALALGDCFAVVSGSAVTSLSISGLPSGVKYDAKTQKFSGAPTKTGLYYVTCVVKNGNGYQYSCTATWNVGDTKPADNDNGSIGADALAQLDNLVTGYAYALVGFGNATAVSGLPSGLKFDKNTGVVAGTPTKPGKAVVTFTGKNKQKSTHTVIVTDGGMYALTLAVAARSSESASATNKATVAGGGVYVVGKSVTVKATAAKGNVFAGWYDEDGVPLSGSADFRTASFPYVMGGKKTVLTATFASEGGDKASLKLVNVTNVTAAVDGSLVLDLGGCVESLSLPKLAVTGLPSGLKYDAKTLKVSGKATKPGVYKVKVAATNTSVKKATDGTTVTFELTVPNFESDKMPGLRYATDAYGTNSVGVMFGPERIDCKPADGWTVKVSGLPAGLKFDTKTGKIVGVPTKAGVFTVTFTLSKKGEKNQVATITLQTEALLAWAVGTFDGGLISTEEADNGAVLGLVQGLTVSTNGKVSGKVINGDGTWTLSAASFDSFDAVAGAYVATIIGKNGKQAFTNEVRVSASEFADTTRGLAEMVGDGARVVADQNLWKAEPWKTTAKGFSNKKLEIEVDGVEGAFTSGTLNLKFASSGTVTTAGKFVTGVNEKTKKDITYSASCSSVLIPQGGDAYIAYIYFPPKKDSKGNVTFEGYSALVPLVWDAEAKAFVLLTEE